MLVYSLKILPDLTLSKYQLFAQSGIDGILDVQLQFLKQIHRISLMSKIHTHFIYSYDPKLDKGKRLNIYLCFSGNESTSPYYNKIRNIVSAANISEYFELAEINMLDYNSYSFKYLSVMNKKERLLQTVVNEEERYFYVVPNWKINESARLYNLFRTLKSFDEPCCYRVDLYTEAELEEQIHKSFERPLSYLRNISNREKGISEYSRIQKDNHDPNADETLHQYEDWLKAVDSSSVFRCRVCAMANDGQLSQILLDSAMAESIEQGNGTITVFQGQFSSLSDLNNMPDGYYIQETPNSLKNWSTSFTVEEIAPFARFPVLYDGENIEMPKETVAELSDNGFVLGYDNNNNNVNIPLNSIPKHMFVCGVPGAGKTNTMLHIANSLWNYVSDSRKTNIPFLVLEPAKREYRELALFDIPELIIFSPSACTNFPIKINPFEFAKGLTLSEHISRLCQVFEGAFPIAPPTPFILDRAIQAIYESHGWNVKDINMGNKEYPTMSELYSQFEKELLETNYDSEIRGNIQSVLEMRIGSLLRREMKDIFDVSTSTLSPEEWLQKPVIVELEALGEGPANFVTLLLCTLIRETLKVNPKENPELPVRHVIFIEEAHNLIGPESQIQNGQDSNPKIAATSYIVKMLAEVRALREGLIIADQLPTAMAPEVIKNTNVKLVHRLTSADDRELVGSTMSASVLQMENIATYTSGQALISYEKLLRPFEIQVSFVEEHGQKTPDDNELYEIMLTKPGYFALCKREEEAKWASLKEKVQHLNQTEIKAVKQLQNFNVDGTKYSVLESRIESCVDTLNGIKLLRKRYSYECSNISERFITTEKKSAMSEIISQIGTHYENSLKLIIENYI